MRILKYIMMLSIILLINCCNSPTEPTTINKILPLNKGNIWVYQEYSINRKGISIKKGLDTIKVIRDAIVDDFKFYYIDFFGSIYDIGYINDSLYLYVDPNNKYIKPSPLYLYPYNKVDFYLSDMGKCNVENIDTTITVQAGKFKCIKYKFNFMNEASVKNNQYHYCSPGVGLIKIEKFENSVSNLDIFLKYSEIELINFNINK